MCMRIIIDNGLSPVIRAKYFYHTLQSMERLIYEHISILVQIKIKLVLFIKELLVITIHLQKNLASLFVNHNSIEKNFLRILQR